MSNVCYVCLQAFLSSVEKTVGKSFYIYIYIYFYSRRGGWQMMLQNISKVPLKLQIKLLQLKLTKDQTLQYNSYIKHP